MPAAEIKKLGEPSPGPIEIQGIRICLMWVDGSDAPVANGSATFDVTIMEVADIVVDSSGTIVQRVVAGATLTGVTADQVLTVAGFRLGNLVARIHNTANLPASAVNYVLNVREF